MHLSELEGEVIVVEVVFALMKPSLQILIEKNLKGPFKNEVKGAWNFPEKFGETLVFLWVQSSGNPKQIHLHIFWVDELNQ